MLRTDPLIKVIPGTGPKATSARLVRVANILDTHPEQHHQSFWFKAPADMAEEVDSSSFIDSLADELHLFTRPQRIHCGTTRCVAGWAVTITPSSQLEVAIVEAATNTWGPSDYEVAGASALGLTGDGASELFHTGGTACVLSRALRRLAELPPEERDGRHVRQAKRKTKPVWASA